MPGTLESGDTRTRFFCIEADHVDPRIEFFQPDFPLKLSGIVAIHHDYASACQWLPALSPVKTDHLMPLLEQQLDNAGTDISGSTDYADFHAGILRNPSQLRYPAIRNPFDHINVAFMIPAG